MKQEEKLEKKVRKNEKREERKLRYQKEKRQKENVCIKEKAWKKQNKKEMCSENDLLISNDQTI